MTIRIEDFEDTKIPINADDRGRITLGAESKGKSYSVGRNDIGQFLLTPVVTIPVHELWLHRNQETMDSVQRGIAQSAAGEVHDLGSFAEFVNLEDE